MSGYSWSDPPSPTAFAVARAGYPFIFASVFATAVFALAKAGIRPYHLGCVVFVAVITGGFPPCRSDRIGPRVHSRATRIQLPDFSLAKGCIRP